MQKLIILFLSLLPFASIQSQQRYLVNVKSFPALDSDQPGEFLTHPYDLIIFKGFYFVTDAIENCIKVFSHDGKLQNIIGSKGKGPGELLDPFVLTIDETRGIIYCQDGGNRRISCFSVKGKYLNSFRTTYPVYDMIWHKGKIYSASYNEQTKTLFAYYDTLNNIQKLFGTFFDHKINKLRYKKSLYSKVFFKIHENNLYVFYAHLPIIQVYDSEESLIQTININVKQIIMLGEDNLNAKKERGRLKIKIWLRGADITADKIFCYSPPLKSLMVLDHSGNLIDKVPFKENIDEKNLYSHHFISKTGDKYNFVDNENAQVRIYKIVRE